MELSLLEEKNVLKLIKYLVLIIQEGIWPSVKDFKRYSQESKILDEMWKCKNMMLKEDLLREKLPQFYAFDISDNLLDIANKKVNNYYKKVGYDNIPKFYKANIINIPENDNTFDFVISIAVIHHLDNFDKRVQAILECLRVLKSGGKFMFQIWSFEQKDTNLNLKVLCTLEN